MHTEHSWAPAVKMYHFIQKCPLADMLSGGAMRHAVWGYVVFVLIGSCVTDKKDRDILRPLFRWSWDSFKNDGISSLIDEVYNIQSCL